MALIDAGYKSFTPGAGVAFNQPVSSALSGALALGNSIIGTCLPWLRIAVLSFVSRCGTLNCGPSPLSF